MVNPLKRKALDNDMTASVAANKASFDVAGAAWEKGDTGASLLEAGKGVAGLVKDFGGDALNQSGCCPGVHLGEHPATGHRLYGNHVGPNPDSPAPTLPTACGYLP